MATKKKRGRPKKKSVKKTKPRRKRAVKKPIVPTFEDIGGFDRTFRPAIRVRAVRQTSQRKMNLVLGNLLLFIILFVLSSILYVVSTAEFYRNMFFLVSLIFGGLSIAFLIILLALVFLRILKQQ
jgi:hypothetical protein